MDGVTIHGGTTEQAGWLRESLGWPELPRIARHIDVHFKPMPSTKAGHAGAVALILAEKDWRKRSLQTIFVHEWAHVYDFNHLTGEQRTLLYPGPLSWRSKNQIDPATGDQVRYREVPDERFAASVGRMICEPRIGTAGVNRLYEPFDLNLVRRFTMPFTDTTDRSDEELEALQWALQNDRINGYPDNTFRPDEPLTRIQYVLIEFRARADS